MKDIFTFASFVAIANAMGPPKSKTPVARHNGDYTAISYEPAPPTSTDNSLVPSPIVVNPLPESSDCLDTQPCSTVVITVTTVYTIPVSHVLPSLTSETATSDLSTVTAPQQSVPATQTEESSIAAPEDLTTETPTDISVVTSPESDIPTATATDTATETEENSVAPTDVPTTVSEIDESSVATPEVPSPVTDEPTETSAAGTGSYTAAPTLPEFTAAADAIRVPAVVAGLLGWAALVM